LFTDYLNGKVWAPKFTELTADTILGARCHGFVEIIHLQYVFGAKMYTDTTSFAPLPVDDMFFEFRFCHTDS